VEMQEVWTVVQGVFNRVPQGMDVVLGGVRLRLAFVVLCVDYDLISPTATGATAGQYYGTSLAMVQDPAVTD
jgi:hypothetical protein